jgi:hypothetical protein
MKGNEKVFVHGRSALQSWEDYRHHEQATGKWDLVDVFVLPSSNYWVTDVYAVVPSHSR